MFFKGFRGLSTIFHENKGLQWEKKETAKHFWVDVHPASGTEVYKADSEGGSYVKGTGHFTFLTTNASLNLYTRSTAGHTVTVNYVFDDASGNTKAPVTESVKYNGTETFNLVQDHYDYTIKRESGDATHKVDTFNRLSVTGGAENSVFTVTYTPKKNMAYLDQYYKKEGFIEYPKWNKEHLSFNGPDVLDNNRYEKAYLIQGGHLTELLESARFLDVDGTIYDFTAAKPLPSDLKVVLIDKVWYDRQDAKWYYTSTEAPNIPVPFTSIVNLYYGEKHKEASEHHRFDQVVKTVLPTCEEKGYTVYKCAYCDKTETRKYTDPLNHDWNWVHDDTTSGAESQHYQVCQRSGCDAKGTPVDCNFEKTTAGTITTYTCEDCGHSYTDEITPTGTFVYVYFQTVHSKDGNVRVNDGDGVTYNNNTGGWATLGRLTTEQPVSASTDKTEVGKLGAKVKDVDDDPNTKFERYKVNGNVINGNVGISLIDWESIALEPNGAADYVGFGKEAWHLNGKVKVYKLSYNANLPISVTESVTGMPDSAYYLPGGNATVSTADPTLQGYDFGGWYEDSKCEGEAIGTVTVTGDTDLYAKWTPAQPITADLIDNNIIIKHSVNGDPAHGDDSTTVHIVNKDAQISYQATLDMQSLKFGDNPENKTAVSVIQKMIGNASLWEFMMGSNITMFADSTVNLHVKFSDKLVNPAALNNITLESGWFKRDPAKLPAYDEATGYWTIPCVIKNAKDEPNTNDSIITLSGITLSLTDKAQGMLNSNTALDIISEGYIDGTIKIYDMYELSLIGRSQGDPAQNTAKLKLDVPTYTVTYTDGANGSAFKDQVYSGLKSGVATPAFNGTPERDGYTFNSWEPAVDKTVTKDATYTATWTRNSSRDDDDDKYFFAIQKVDAQDGHALNDAKFELYQRDNRGNKLAAFRKTTSHWGPESGIALFSVSATKTNEGGDTWYYREITAPEGYVLDTKEYEISASDFYHNDQSKAVAKAETVRNYRGSTPDLLNGDDHFAYVVGYQDGCVHPNALITRAETATIFFRLLKDSVRDGNLLTSNTFADVPNDYWANTAISTMAGLGIVQGYNSTAFAPNASITRAEFAAICARFDTGKSSGTQTFTDIKGHWAEKYIERAAELGWIKGLEDGTFRPNDCITRAQAMTMINRVLNRIPEENGDLLSSMNVWPDCNPGDWFYLAVQEATNSHDFKHKAGNYETWTSMKQDPDWTRYEN